MNPNLISRVCETYAFHGQLGLTQRVLPHCSAVYDRHNPNVWSSNKIYAVTGGDYESLFADLREVFSHTNYLHFMVDPQAPSEFEATLVVRDFTELEPTVQMVRSGPAEIGALPGGEVVSVTSDADWSVLAELVLEDHSEGARTAGPLSRDVSKGIIAGFKAKAESCQFFIVYLGSKAVGYGSGTVCPNGMGMIEDVFTLPEYRGRGMASRIIEHCISHCSRLGAVDFLIGSHANAPPKRLYNKLGFQPVCMTREYIKTFSAGQE